MALLLVPLAPLLQNAYPFLWRAQRARIVPVAHQPRHVEVALIAGGQLAIPDRTDRYAGRMCPQGPRPRF